MPLANVPFLEGWILLSDAAEDLGISRQALYEKASRAGVDTIRRLGRKRPVYVVREAELPALRAALSPSHQERARRRTEDPDEVPDSLVSQDQAVFAGRVAEVLGHL